MLLKANAMIKEFINDTLEIDDFLENDLLLKRVHQKCSEYATSTALSSARSLLDKVVRKKVDLKSSSEFSSLERNRIVIDS